MSTMSDVYHMLFTLTIKLVLLDYGENGAVIHGIKHPRYVLATTNELSVSHVTHAENIYIQDEENDWYYKPSAYYDIKVKLDNRRLKKLTVILLSACQLTDII